jgi:hypothetical protein
MIHACNAAIAGEQPSVRDGMDRAERIDPVLQWHSAFSDFYIQPVIG